MASEVIALGSDSCLPVVHEAGGEEGLSKDVGGECGLQEQDSISDVAATKQEVLFKAENWQLTV